MRYKYKSQAQVVKFGGWSSNNSFRAYGEIGWSMVWTADVFMGSAGKGYLSAWEVDSRFRLRDVLAFVAGDQTRIEERMEMS